MTTLAKLRNELRRCIEQDKVYLQSDLTVSKLAILLDTNRTYLSAIIQEEYKTGFIDLINRLRIQEAYKLFEKHPKHEITIERISELSGFNNKSTFNSAFKRYTNTTPSRYWKKIWLKRQKKNVKETIEANLIES